jgi:RNA polymerase sigma-70 factor (ECF subfamily)
MAPTLIEQLQSHHVDNWGWALACCDWRRAAAEDALQEAYLRVLDGRARFGGASSAKTWFFGVVRRVSAEQRRRQARHAVLNLTFLQQASEPEQDPSFRTLDTDESNHQLREALRCVSPRQREVLHLVFYSGLTLEQAAQAMSMSLGSVRTHYHRGKLRLAELLDRDHD